MLQPDFRLCARPKPAAAAALQRLLVARDALEREEARAKERIGELDRRLEQFAADLARERTLAADAAAALDRLDAEETTLKAEAQDERDAAQPASTIASPQAEAALAAIGKIVRRADRRARRSERRSAISFKRRCTITSSARNG